MGEKSEEGKKSGKSKKSVSFLSRFNPIRFDSALYSESSELTTDHRLLTTDLTIGVGGIRFTLCRQG
jgi:hypothetical protein